MGKQLTVTIRAEKYLAERKNITEEEYNGKPLRAQLMIPPGSANIMLEGEIPMDLFAAGRV